jgi:thiamine biosynthesis lipoprotein
VDRARHRKDVLTLYRYTFQAMAAAHELTLAAADAALAQRAAEAAIADVHRIEAKYSRYRADSVLSRINATAGGNSVDIDDETAALLAYADRCHRQSEGAFDITSGVLRRAWNFRADTPALPDPRVLDEARALVGWQDVEWDAHRVRLPRPGMELDLGGIGKEYAADRAATILSAHGIAHALVNLGGDVRSVGTQPDGRSWRVGLAHPRVHGGVIGEVELSGGAVATSGDYERYFVLDGRRYCHILDPRSGWPVDHWQSASVLAPLCTLAGSLATMAMLRADAEAFLRAQGVRFLLVDRDGGMHAGG